MSPTSHGRPFKSPLNFGQSINLYITLLSIGYSTLPTYSLQCRAFGDTYKQGLEPSHAERYCEARSFCGRMDAGNDVYHEVVYFCDEMNRPQLKCETNGCIDYYRYPNVTASWMLVLHEPVPPIHRNTTYFRFCCCDSKENCLPDPEQPTCSASTLTAFATVVGVALTAIVMKFD